ncbi:MAG: DcaP family trimeric outer membrane transporter [Pseudomonadota bacterium]
MLTTKRPWRQALLLCGVSPLLFGYAAAQSEDHLKIRVDTIEAKLDKIIERLDDEEEMLTPEETQDVREAVRLMKTSLANGDIGTSGFGEAPPEVILAERPQGFMSGDTEVLFGGFIKLDVSLTEFTDGELPTNSLGRDFYIPGLVPVGGDGGDPVIDFNPRETRFFFGFKNEAGKHKVGGKIEFDFQVTNDGNERVSNSFSPRMRLAFVTVDNWLFGQTWSTFQDVVALPENLDFIGPTEGTVFERQPMIRYTRGPFQIALEQPETEITTETGGRILTGDDTLPDIALRYNAKGDYGHLSLATLFRQLKAGDDVTGVDTETAWAWGFSGSGKIRLGAKDDFRFMGTYGEGIGRYIGVNIVNDAALLDNGELELIETVSGFASIRHFWNDRWRSNLSVGYFRAGNPVRLTSGDVTDEVSSIHANLIYAVSPKIDIGVELIRADRELENGLDGAMNKLQFSAKYGF